MSTSPIDRSIKCPKTVPPQSLSEEYFRSYSWWYINFHPYIAVDKTCFRAPLGAAYNSYLELRNWIPVMEPGYIESYNERFGDKHEKITI